jgi:hypothetical protein
VFKLRLQQFLNNRYTKNCIPNEWRYAIVNPIFKKVTEETLKNTEDFVFLTPAISYTLNP